MSSAPKWFHGFSWRSPRDWLLLLVYAAVYGSLIALCVASS